MKIVKTSIREMRNLIEELESYKKQKQLFLLTLDDLFNKYLNKQIGYTQYIEKRENVLKGKSRDDWINYYDAYLLYILKKIDIINSQLFRELTIQGPTLKNEESVEHLEKETTKEVKKEIKQEAKNQQLKEKELKKEQLTNLQNEVKKELPANSVKEEQIIPQDIKEKKGISVSATKSIIKIKAPKKGMFDKLLQSIKPGPISQYNRSKNNKGVSMGGLFGIGFIKVLRERAQKKPQLAAEKTTITNSTMRLGNTARGKDTFFEDQAKAMSKTSLTEEAKRVKGLLDKRGTVKIYSPSFWGSLANLTSKKISLWMIDQFPDFFKELYITLRLADVKMLSNTYVNLMVFLSMIGGILTGVLLFGWSLMTGIPFIVAVVRGIFFTVIGAIIIFALAYSYPSSKANGRKMSIKTNMPFAINHMAAVASSGVVPTKMFRLISESTEYGEIASEAEKIVNYIDIFGYDFLTATKSVAQITPCPEFKEFLEGMVSTTQSGGDVKNYLAQKSTESMSTYELDRKRYTDTISTYSDIYTGILIAAPLFFVAALSLVSMLGGKIGNVSPSFILVMGTYVVIPGLNLAFLAFLKLSQPAM